MSRRHVAPATVATRGHSGAFLPVISSNIRCPPRLSRSAGSFLQVESATRTRRSGTLYRPRSRSTRRAGWGRAAPRSLDLRISTTITRHPFGLGIGATPPRRGIGVHRRRETAAGARGSTSSARAAAISTVRTVRRPPFQDATPALETKSTGRVSLLATRYSGRRAVWSSATAPAAASVPRRGEASMGAC